MLNCSKLVKNRKGFDLATITDTKPTALSKRIGKKLRDEILSQGYKPGDKLPTVAELASIMSVSDRTIQCVLAEMKRDGIVSSYVGRGTFLERVPDSNDSLTPCDSHKAIFKNTIAVLDGQSEIELSEHTESWTTRILHGIRVEAAANGIDLLLLNERPALESLVKRLADIGDNIDGVITFPFTDNYTMSRIFEKAKLPVVTINRSCADARDNFVGADYFEGSKMVGAAFAEIKAKRVAFLTTQMAGIYSKEQRYKGLVEGLRFSGNNCDVDIIILESATDVQGYEAVKCMVQENKIPQAVYCSGDYIAMGVLKALKEAGIRIGVEDGVSVIGSSGFELSAHTDPPLSVVQIPMIEMGRRAVSKILEARNDDARRSAGETLPTKLILRDTTPASLRQCRWLEKIEENKMQVHI